MLVSYYSNLSYIYNQENVINLSSWQVAFGRDDHLTRQIIKNWTVLQVLPLAIYVIECLCRRLCHCLKITMVGSGGTLFFMSQVYCIIIRHG